MMKHKGTMEEFFEFDYELDEPIDYTEPTYGSRKTPGTTWRYTRVVIRFKRTRVVGEGWKPWRFSITGDARNVLKSGEVGQRTPSSYDRHLTSVESRYSPDSEVAEWCRATVEPLLVEARSAVSANAWDGAW